MKEINDIIYGEGEDKLKEKLKMYKENPEKVLKFFETKYTYSTYNDTYYKLNNPNNIVYKKYGEVEMWSMNNNYGKKPTERIYNPFAQKVLALTSSSNYTNKHVEKMQR